MEAIGKENLVDSPENIKDKMRKLALEINARAGIPAEPTMTPEELKEKMKADGIKPEENIFSRELIRMRYGRDVDEG